MIHFTGLELLNEAKLNFKIDCQIVHLKKLEVFRMNVLKM